MWGIILEHSSTHSTLVCTNPDLSQEYIYLIKLVYHPNHSINFTLAVKPEKTEALANKFVNILINDNNEITMETDEGSNSLLKFIVDVQNNNLSFLNQVLNILGNEVIDFKPIEAKLPLLIQPEKKAIIFSNQLSQKKFVVDTERYIDNNMRASVFATDRASELQLRLKYNFPAPHYGKEQNEDSYNAFDEDFVSEQYSEAENQLICDLHKTLLSKQEELINDEYLEFNSSSEYGTDIILTEYAKDLLTNDSSQNSEESQNKETAKLALDIMASIRALDYGGSHSHNRRMHKTKIVGYGMRNIVALMWHCIKEADKYHFFMPNVTFEQGLTAIVQGIANGARGGNRNFANGDNLIDEDKRVCDQGRYNTLISAFLGVFTEVNIVFDISGPLNKYLQQEIILRLINYKSVISYKAAIDYLDTWLGKNQFMKPYGFAEFELEIKNKNLLDNIINDFLNKFCNHDLSLKGLVKQQIEEEICKVEKFSFGLSYIEQISPTHNELLMLWQEKLKAKLHTPTPANMSYI